MCSGTRWECVCQGSEQSVGNRRGRGGVGRIVSGVGGDLRC